MCLWEAEEFVVVVDRIGFVFEDGEGRLREEGEGKAEEVEWEAHCEWLGGFNLVCVVRSDNAMWLVVLMMFSWSTT
jgi:hypothetical protein